MLESITIFDDCFINDNLLEYTPKDWRYAIPQTISEVKKLAIKTITNENISIKKRWIFKVQSCVINEISDKNSEKNNEEIYSLGYEVKDGHYFRIYHDQYAGNIEMPVEEDEYFSSIASLNLLPETPNDVLLEYSIFSIVEFIAYRITNRHSYLDCYGLNNDNPIISEIEVFLLSALTLAVRADEEEHGNNGYLCEKANLATQAMQCLIKAKELIANNELFESEKNTNERIKSEVTLEVQQQLDQERKRNETEHAKMMASARKAKHTAAKELLSKEWLSRYKNENWNSADAAAEALRQFMKNNGFNYKFRWMADAIREAARDNGIKFR